MKMTVNFMIRKCSVSNVIVLAAYGEELFKRERPRRLEKAMEENAELHERLGFDNHSYVALKFKNWIIEGIPDQVFDDHVEECKMVSKHSNFRKLKFTAWLQAGIYALALKLPKFTTVFYRKNYNDDGEPVAGEEIARYDYDTFVEEPKIKEILGKVIKILEEMRELNFTVRQLISLGWCERGLEK